MRNTIRSLEKPIPYIDAEGKRSQLILREEVLEVLKADPKKLDEFRQTLKRFRSCKKDRKLSRERRDDEVEQAIYKYYYTLWTNKLLTLNTSYDDTKYVKQLLYATERYRFLANEDLPDLIDLHLAPLLKKSYRRRLESFFTVFLRNIANSRTIFESAHISLNPDSLISHQELFAADSHDEDVRQLLAAMKVRDKLPESGGNMDYASYDKGVTAEFIIWYLTQTSHFTYDIKKAIAHTNDSSQRFYLGPDRAEMIEKRIID